jgi:hypothetical protein
MVQKYFKRSYEDALKYVIPEVYFNNELETSATAVRLDDSVVNSVINFCVNQPSLLNISAVGTLSSINSISGIAEWFIPQHKHSFEITPLEVEVKILHKLNLCTGKLVGNSCTYSRDASGVDRLDLSGTIQNKLFDLFSDYLLPKIPLNSSALADLTSSAFAKTASGTHDYLARNLGWLYFLNTSGSSYNPSSYVASALTDMYASSLTYKVNDGVKGTFDYIWRNWGTASAVNTNLLPTNFYSGTGQYVSGTQNLDKLKTLVDVVYDDHPLAKSDTYIYDAFIDYISNGNLLESRESTGQFSKFMKAASYSFFDTNSDVQLLSYLYSIEDCPAHLLKYLAELIGWELRGTNPESWRRQLMFAMKLYKQKGTKEGLYNALTTVLPGTSIETSSISEFYESYVPFLIYYLLKTDTSLFSSFTSWSPIKASEYCGKEYSYVDMDYNIRVVIDHMLLKAVKAFPELFYVKNFKFDLEDPDFVFEYRDKAFNIPPWEEVKFYRDVDLTEDLITFFKNELICLGVTRRNADLFYDYVFDNTVDKEVESKFYNNSFLFFTSGLNRAPNEDSILRSKEFTKYDYLSLWNGKSSHFDVTVSSGSFDSQFFNTDLFTKQDFFQSLSIVEEFSPAKSIPRTHVDLSTIDTINRIAYKCPSVRYALQDLAFSGFQGASNSSGVNIRGVSGAVGGDFPTPTNSSRSVNNHATLPVFGRDFIDNSYDPVQLDGSSLSALPLTDLFRTNLRRRDYSKNLRKSGWYSRTGFNMPSYYNLSDEGSDSVEFYPLGFINSQYKYQPVINYLNLYETSSWPWNTSVWTDCWTKTADYSLCTVDVSSTFPIRGDVALSANSCNSYVLRDRTHEFVKFLYRLRERKFQQEAKAIYATNQFLIDTSSFIDPITSIANKLSNDSTLDLEEVYSTVIGARIFSRGSVDGVHKTFKDYISYFTETGIGNYLIDDYLDGGPNILSHTYGPTVYNGYLRLTGSALDISSSLIEKSAYSTSYFNISSFSTGTTIFNISATTVDDMYVETPEVRNPYILSGVELVDSSGGASRFSIYNLDTSNASKYRDNYNIDNPLVVINADSPFPRLRFDIKDYGEYTNLLIPERDFKFTINGNFGRSNSLELGKGAFGVWIHTDVETDYDGNKVFWNFMPDGTWRMVDANLLQAKGGVNYVKSELSHALDYDEEVTYVDGDTKCFESSSTQDIIGLLQKKDFISKDFLFNTQNQPIKVPYVYFKKENQVHREGQNYIIEVFPYNNTFTDTFAIINYVSIQDLKLANRARTKFGITYPDYTAYKYPLETYKFYDSSSFEVPSGVDISLDSSGNMTTSSGDKVTCHISDSIGQFNIPEDASSYGSLYAQISAVNLEEWVKDSQGKLINLGRQDYEGIIQLGSSGNIIPEAITILGKRKGSYINKSETVFIKLDPEDLLLILREFKRLQEGDYSRDKTKSASQFGAEGGSRINYKTAPMWVLSGAGAVLGDSKLTFERAAGQYTQINLEN